MNDKYHAMPIKFQDALYNFKIFFCFFNLQILNIAVVTVKVLSEEKREKIQNL